MVGAQVSQQYGPSASTAGVGFRGRNVPFSGEESQLRYSSRSSGIVWDREDTTGQSLETVFFSYFDHILRKG